MTQQPAAGESKGNVKSVLRVPVSEIRKDVQKYMNDAMMSLTYQVDVHSIKVERKNGVDILAIEVSRRPR